ncbi:uncharacterized protein A1O5_12800 [Cladophialophora psammophila CBS 110553]|uniref:Xylanolytic transcriptional activator regulatory domain-containing protein n=1 Tax=Cladophialophora psammophila CBS 110553 TaxID=1182543 RepID=W9VSA7_9EURO|nr:uncharacterized protein A1O5_12800 [Cladophialophora psammophila CBS 110553]EXJ55061.1 hypothetical protein A1O5_12800 [Cladophialophora psammophila CBS 110553]
MSLGLNEKGSYSTKRLRDQKLWRRLRWCCYVRDRMIAIGTRKPMHFADDQVRIPALSLDDFDLETPSTAMTRIQDAFTMIDYDCRVALAKMFMAKVKLLSTVGRVLEKLYLLRSIRGPNTGPRMFYNPKVSNFDLEGFLKRANELDE